MDKRQTVIVYGDSVVLAGVRTSLSFDPAFEVIACAFPLTDQELRALQPPAIIFDAQAVQPEFRYALAQEMPGLLLIGIDPSANQVVVWSGQQLRELSTQDLVKVINQKATDFKSL